MITRRVIACLDVLAGRVVKGVRFRSLRESGDPVELAAGYEAGGADEIVFLRIAAGADAPGPTLDLLTRTAERLFIPLTVGGGVNRIGDVGTALRSGADKVSVNTGAVRRPALIDEAARRYGAQCVVASIDAARGRRGWRVVTHGGRRATRLDAVAWARECVERGAGEILLTSIDRDGTRAGYDLALTRAVADAVRVPVIASGGAGSADDVCAALTAGGADAALVAGILHDRSVTVAGLKARLRRAGLPVRAA